MTDCMCAGYMNDPLPAPSWEDDPTPDPFTALEIRVRDLELVVKAYGAALDHLLVSLPASHSKDLKYKIRPVMDPAAMITSGY